MSDFAVYGMKLQPGGTEEDAFGFCHIEEIVGVGWGGIADKGYEEAREFYDEHLEKRKHRAE